MTVATYYVGDARKVLAGMPEASADLLITSPPYLSLRSYLKADDPAKADEMGSEATPGAFIDALLDVVEECRRVLAPHGSICIEFGDTYAGSGGAGGDYNSGGLRDGQAKFDGSNHRRGKIVDHNSGRRTPSPGWPLAKSLCMVPEMFRMSLAYGFNPLTGRTTPRWRVRNVIRHFRPNPPVGALGDKVRPATSEWVVACVGTKRYFDLDSVRGPGSPNTHARLGVALDVASNAGKSAGEGRGGGWSTLNSVHLPAGAPPLDWWDDDDLEWRDAAGFIAPTFGYPGSHYATFSPRVIARLIEPMCPRRVCTVCGKPSERIATTTNAIGSATGRRSWREGGTDGIGAGHVGVITRSSSSAPSAIRETTGWTDCGHDAWRSGVVLDPFAGTGVTGQVATGNGRDAVLIDLDRDNLALARERVGMFLVEATA